MKLQTKITLYASIFMLVIIITVNTIIYFMFYKISTENELSQLTDQTNAIVETMKDNPEISKKRLLQAFLPSNGMIRLVDDSDVIATFAKDESYTGVSPTYTAKETSEVMKDDNGSLVALVQKPIIYEEGNIVTLQVANYLISLDETMKTLLYVLAATSL